MKLGIDTTEVVLSNVGPTGEFRIRNSAKAFKILSDGLYSNKIKAIIRELSCNALDSHVGAGKKDVPFEVHLPSMFEPWFAVRDFGMGLSADQVENIYTTYFESTKTDSNDFIGALGLGSKSPFSYTDNFTITATQNGRQCIFSAFIDDKTGVPSVAKMADTLSDAPNGVEVKFSVTDRQAYQSFRNEATEVFKWFEFKPNVVGDSSYKHQEIEFKNKDIIPGVSELIYNGYGHGWSYAVMGNICYPLNNIPEPQKHFGKLYELLSCGLVLKFDIGELDFAASREQLSYVPLTLSSIKKKLELLNDSLADVLADKADKIENEWLRSVFLSEQARTKLFSQAVPAYAKKTKFPLYNDKEYYGTYTFSLETSALEKLGIEISAFSTSNGSCYNISKHKKHDYANNKTIECLDITVSDSAIFVLNDLKTGCNARARYHYGKSFKTNRNSVYCLSSNETDPDERQKVYDTFIKTLHNPPVIVLASSLDKKAPVPKDPLSNVGIAFISKKASRNSWRESNEYMWASTAEELDDKKKYYYCALNGHESYRPDNIVGNGSNKHFDMLSVRRLMKASGLPEFDNFEIYGVRKTRIKELNGRKNWIWIEEKIAEIVKKVNNKTIVDMISSTILDDYNNKVYINKSVALNLDASSQYRKFIDEYGDTGKQTGDIAALVELCTNYGNIVEVENVKKKIRDDRDNLNKKYPLMKYFSRMGIESQEAIEYINLIDKQEKN